MSKKYIRREKSYSSAFGGRTQPVKEFNAIHKRWIEQLTAALPDGVPPDDPVWRCKRCDVSLDIHERAGRCKGEAEPYLEQPTWPRTFAEYDHKAERPIHNDLGGGYCLQCGGCQYYITLESRLGDDWGACTNPRSQYDRTCVFEHWSCREFRF